MRARWSSSLLLALVSLGGFAYAASGQLAAAPAGTPRHRIGPLLPTEGLLRGGTWLELGERLLTRLVEYLPSLAAALIVLLFFLLASRLVVRVLRGILQRPHVDPALRDVLLPLARYVVLGLGVIMALAQANFQVGSLVAGVGVAGLALGLAAQDTLGNLVAGFSLLWDRPFRLGDRVTIADTYGEVVKIGLRSTRLRTNDQLHVILPNREVVNKVIVNHTLTPNLRVAAPFMVDYREDIGRVRAAVVKAVEGHPKLRSDPPPFVVVKELGAVGVQLELRAWLVDPQTERSTRWAMLELVMGALQAANIATPVPQSYLQLDRGSPLRVAMTAEPGLAAGPAGGGEDG